MFRRKIKIGSEGLRGKCEAVRGACEPIDKFSLPSSYWPFLGSRCRPLFARVLQCLLETYWTLICDQLQKRLCRKYMCAHPRPCLSPCSSGLLAHSWCLMISGVTSITGPCGSAGAWVMICTTTPGLSR
jgi:hypothetical protein